LLGSERGCFVLAALTPPAGSYDWLLDVLYGGSVAAASPGESADVTWAPQGELPNGYRPVEQFAVAPGGRDRAFLISLGSRRGAASALTSYNALRPASRRAVRAVLGLGLRSGLSAPFLRRRIDIGARAVLTAAEAREALITGHIARLLGQDQVVLAIGGGSGPYRKPVLQVFGTGGTPLAYVKVGWSAWTRDAVRREADALRSCAARPATGRLGAPGLLHHGEWRDLELLVTAPLPSQVRPPAPQLPASFLREICELSPVTTSPLGDSAWWAGIGTRIATAVCDLASRDRLAAAAGQLESAHGQDQLEFGRWHGDLVPWNLASLGPRLYAWDWESSSASAPVGLDAVHFGFQVAFVTGRLPLAESVRRAAESARPALAALAVPASAQPLLSELHLLELAVRHEEARGGTADADDRFYPAVFDVLGDIRSRATVSTQAAARERVA
jgi:hypothetical protein